MPTVSIITCTYNRASLIVETIRHVLAQSYTDYEYIIVDESSTDNTEEVVRSFDDNRIHYYKIPNTNGHLSKLRNFGMQKSRGTYIAFVDSDDLWLTDKLHQQVKALEEDPSIDFSYTDVQTFNEQGILKERIYADDGNLSKNVFEDFIENKFVICATTLFFRRRCLDKIGLQDERFHSGDFDFIVSLAINFRAYVINTPLVRVRRHNSNVSDAAHLNRKFGHLRTLEKIKEAQLISVQKYKQIRTNLYYAFGMQLLRTPEFKWTYHFFIKTLLSNPFQVKPWIRIAQTMLKQIHLIK